MKQKERYTPEEVCDGSNEFLTAIMIGIAAIAIALYLIL